MGSELKVNWYMASFAIDQLVRSQSYQSLEGCSICPECHGYHAIPSFPHGIHYLLQIISDLLVRCSWLAIGLGMVWSIVVRWFYSQLPVTLPIGLVL